MANASPVSVGKINAGGSEDALFLKVFSGEVLTSFERASVTQGAETVRTISNGKSAQFPVMGRIDASYHEGSFEPKDRWAMDWYYPARSGAVDAVAGAERLRAGWETFVMEDLGVRCVSDEPWITASETAEASIAHAAVGDPDTATRLLGWTRDHRLASGAYLTGLVHPERIVFPADEHSSYTAAAVILAVDAIRGDSPASRLFRHD